MTYIIRKVSNNVETKRREWRVRVRGEERKKFHLAIEERFTLLLKWLLKIKRFTFCTQSPSSLFQCMNNINIGFKIAFVLWNWDTVNYCCCTTHPLKGNQGAGGRELKGMVVMKQLGNHTNKCHKSLGEKTCFLFVESLLWSQCNCRPLGEWSFLKEGNKQWSALVPFMSCVEKHTRKTCLCDVKPSRSSK